MVIRMLGLGLLMTGACHMSLIANEPANQELQVVPDVDLSRYAGKWYEIARLPNRFQRDCDSDTSATYTLRPDGKIGVLNECRKADGRMKSIRGTAKPAA